MRDLLSVLLTLTVSFSVSAQEPQQPSIVKQINNSGTLTVDIPEALSERLTQEDASSHNTGSGNGTVRTRGSVGYRVEIFADNNARTAKGQAQMRRSKIVSRLPQFPAYLVFESPYWRVRVGDFTTRTEAESAMAEIRRAFPSFSSDLRIVKSRIK